MATMMQRFASSSVGRCAPSWLRSCSAIATASTPSISAAVTSITASTHTTHPTHILPPSSSCTDITVRQRSSRSLRGLYDGKDVRFGNNVPFSLKKTRRRWNPNVQFKRVYSETLDEMIKFHITTSALRSIDKYGGLDNYLLKSHHVSTKGEGEGQRIRNRIIQVMKHRESVRKQAIEDGESVGDWDKIVLVGKKIKS